MLKQLIYTAGMAVATCSFTACVSDNHFIKEADFRAQVEQDFAAKQKEMSRGRLFDIFQQEMTQEEREALQFLYAYMPICDIADYSGEFFLNNVRLALNNRKEASWGKTVPDLLFRHFVLPVRVNNENLDNAREVFQKELWPRVKDLSMQDAILEVNHWCHEKVIYTPSDMRTSAPLATVRTAYGRCGEESTFLVAALRSIGIPARQVYTPRWAHTDDNHAWVEAWADGQWYFLGACEPEPVLNLGWFNAPASRGMLMHTKVFGAYNGPEDVMKQTANYTEINVIDNYATSAPITITVQDPEGNPVQDANVEFKVYNYAEFYTVSQKTSDSNGQASLKAGLGDMVVLASKGDRFGQAKVTFGKDKDVVIRLDHSQGDAMSEMMDIIPPSENARMPEVTPEQRAENTRRMAEEDSIRNLYVGTFPDETKARGFAAEIKLDADKVSSYLLRSRGNYAEIMQFLREANNRKMGERALELLGTISEKDLRDTPCSVLEDHLYQTPADADAATVLSPRIAHELLTPYRSYLQKQIPEPLAASFRKDPQQLVEWCRDSLTVRSDLNTGGTLTSPIGTWNSRVVDALSRDVFFVAAARSLNIPAWIDGVTGNIYYSQNGQRIPVDFEKTAENTQIAEGVLKATYQPIPRLDNPKYYTHFTLSKYENGSFRLLNYPDDATWASLLKNGTPLEAGYYQLVTGSRMANGGVMCQTTLFTVEAGKTTHIELIMRDNAEEIRVIGNFNSEARFLSMPEQKETSVLATTGRGYFVVGILGVGQEPTNHALKDIEVKKAEFEKWGRRLVLLFPDEASFRKFNPADFPNLPSTVVYGIDTDGKIRSEIAENMKLPKGGQLPVFIIGDTFNRVVFEIDGYTIGLGEQMIHTIQGL